MPRPDARFLRAWREERGFQREEKREIIRVKSIYKKENGIF
tara:strand:- start:452 stop:574 length:123 start_codon:yes stop_codon:yes gene_type:complete